MDRFAKANAIYRIDGYYYPHPSENTAEKKLLAFERAKAETIKNMEVAIKQTKAITADDFFNRKG